MDAFAEVRREEVLSRRRRGLNAYDDEIEFIPAPDLEGYRPPVVDPEEKIRRERWIQNGPPSQFSNSYDDEIEFVPSPEALYVQAQLRDDETRKEEKRKKRARKKAKRRERKQQEKASLLPHYKVLGCRAGNRLSTIKKSFRRLAFKYHPDRNQGDLAAEAKYREVNTAFVALLKVLG
jgi:hypothetical protein